MQVQKNEEGWRERGKCMSASSVYSNQHETEVTVGGALTSFIVDHIDQGRMEGDGKGECKFSRYTTINVKQK